ncbi:hypothetical protein [Streptomyces sp. bgisy027]|uniref:hypothetical protein n=1 Tax=Streptomyces sp. bgisy027 TaxID=3413770 RepID=UPI003D70F5C3
MIGEHGDSAVICASSTTIGGRPAVVPLDVVSAEPRDRPRRINSRIGRARNGPAAATVSALRKLPPYAVQLDERLAYHADRRRLVIIGEHSEPVAVAARLAHELVRAQLLADGWTVLHASSAAVKDGRTVLTLGDKGTGKTTTALLLARQDGGCSPTTACSSAPRPATRSKYCPDRWLPPPGSACSMQPASTTGYAKGYSPENSSTRPSTRA